MSNKIQINRVTNANVYVDGASKLGKAEEVTLPVIKMMMSEHKAMGMVGKLEYASGIDKLEAKIKWNSFYADVLKKFGNPFQAVKLQIRSNVETFEDGSRISQVPLVVYLTAQVKDFPLGNFKQQDNAELESNLTVTYCKLELDGEVITEVDVEANIWIHDGVDLLLEYRQNLGI